VKSNGVLAFAGALSMVSIVLVSACNKGNHAGTDRHLESGVASWYGHPYHGRRTASGEVYDMEAMTAAHRTLPFGTVIRVVNVSNSRQTEVRINDRGPFVKNRIVDLSHAGAQKLGFTGTASVTLEVVRFPKTRALDLFAVQVGVFQNRVEAEAARVALAGSHSDARLIAREGDQSWRLLVGMENSEQSAQDLAKRLNPEAGEVFVVRVDSEN
jgi:rare lipoprotein A